MIKNKKTNHLTTLIIGALVIVTLFWGISFTNEYRRENENVEANYISDKEAFIKTHVNSTIEMLDNNLAEAYNIYNQHLETIVNYLDKNQDEIDLYLNDEISINDLVDQYIFVNDRIDYALIDISEGLITYSTKDLGIDVINNLAIQKSIVLDENQELVLYISEENLKAIVKEVSIPLIRRIELEDSGYIWVNEVVNYEGGEDYAIRRVHANLQDTEGQYLSTYAEDAYGNHPYQIELDGINEFGEITFEYYFKKKDSDVVSRKMSYAKLYEPFNWIVATGVHLDDLEAYLIEEKVPRTRVFRVQLFVTLIFLAALIAFFIWKARLSYELIKFQASNSDLSKELQVRADELEVALESLQSAEKQLVFNAKRTLTTQLVAGVAHEINTPLGLSVTCTSHIQDKLNELYEDFNKGELSKASFDKYCTTLIETTSVLESNLDRSVNLVKNFKKVAVDMTTNERREFDVCYYIANLARSLYKSLKIPEYTFDVEYENEIIVDSFPGAIYQLMTNLLMNSINHGFEYQDSGHVTINIKEENNMVSIVYKDNGRGIKEKYMDQIFEPFFTTGKTNGNNGLGLYIVYSLVNTTLGGKIMCRNNNESGCEFRVSFPVVAPTKEEDE